MVRIGLRTVTGHSHDLTNMKTISAEEFKKLYGQDTVNQFPQSSQQSNPITGPISRAFQGGVDQMKKGYGEAQNATNPLEMLGAGLNQAAGAVGAAFSPLAPVLEPTLGAGINFAADKISDVPAVQKFAMSDAGKKTQRVVEGVGNTATLLGTIAGGTKTPSVVRGAIDTTVSTAGKVAETVGKTGEYAKNVVRDVVPDTQRTINHQISKALDFTPGDLANITEKTGNDVGTWMSDHNLIGVNKKTTQANIDSFYRTSYKAVRDEIAKVDKAGITRDANQIPAYKTALSELQKKTDGIAGLEKEAAVIKKLASKEDPLLADVQKAKELLDEHYSLYNITGDVNEGVAKQGLANLRNQLKTYIEKEVQRTTKADISKLNNDVSTARSISDAITKRDPKGLTRANLTTRDLALGWFGSAFGGPLVGIAAVLVKKILLSPTVRLRVSKFLDTLSDARKASIKAQLESGKIPPELNQFVKQKTTSQNQEPSLGEGKVL